MPHFSLVIIGSGSGNLVVPEDPTHGTVALIESDAFGGTCVNRGCIPSKILIRTAELAAQVRHAPEFGIQAKLTGWTGRPSGTGPSPRPARSPSLGAAAGPSRMR